MPETIARRTSVTVATWLLKWLPLGDRCFTCLFIVFASACRISTINDFCSSIQAQIAGIKCWVKRHICFTTIRFSCYPNSTLINSRKTNCYLDHKALQSKTIVKYLNLTAISYDLLNFSEGFVTVQPFSGVLAAECGAKSEWGRKKRRGGGGGREGERRKLSLLLPPLFFLLTSLCTVHNLNAWGRILRVKQTIFLVALAIKIYLMAQVRYIYNSKYDSEALGSKLQIFHDSIVS